MTGTHISLDRSYNAHYSLYQLCTPELLLSGTMRQLWQDYLEGESRYLMRPPCGHK
jgi:hypothetical protein